MDPDDNFIFTGIVDVSTPAFVDEPATSECVDSNQIVSTPRTISETDGCSCDPNDKENFPAGRGNEGYVDGDERIAYRVNFRNEGIGPARLVVIRDAIDPDFDLESFAFEGASHDVSGLTIQPNGELVVRFDPILLPSVNVDPEGSRGWIEFSLDPGPGLPAERQLTNTADIYFDDNLPVTTNTVLNTVLGVCPIDDDGDGVLNEDDLCPGTDTDALCGSLVTFRYADTDGDGWFDTELPASCSGSNNAAACEPALFHVARTGGCSCTQILDASGANPRPNVCGGERRDGCKEATIQNWIDGLSGN